jgi:hypothetical protein
MSGVAQVLERPVDTFLIGLGVGVWLASLIWIVRHGVGYREGYRAGVKMCVEQLQPVRALAASEDVLQVSEDTRQETRH